MMRETMPKHKIKTPRGVTHCFNTLCDVLGLSVVEMWSQGADSFGLVDFHVAQLPDEYVEIVASYHSGDRENVTSRSLSKQALKAKGNYYWIAKQERRLHPEMKFHTAVSFRVPSDDAIGADVYIVAYSLKFNAFTESKMNFFALMSYGAVIAMHSSTLYMADSVHHVRVDEANNKTSSSSGDTHNIRIQLLRDTQLLRDPHAELSSAIHLERDSNMSSVSFSELGSRLSKDDLPPNLAAVRMLQSAVAGTGAGPASPSLFGPAAAAAAAAASAAAAAAASPAASTQQQQQQQQEQQQLGRSSMVDRTLSNLLSALRMPSHDKRAAATPTAPSNAVSTRARAAPTAAAVAPTPVPATAAAAPIITTAAMPSVAAGTAVAGQTAPALSSKPPSAPISLSPAGTTAAAAAEVPNAPPPVAPGDEPGLRELETYSVVSGGSSFQFLKPK